MKPSMVAQEDNARTPKIELIKKESKATLGCIRRS